MYMRHVTLNLVSKLQLTGCCEGLHRQQPTTRSLHSSHYWASANCAPSSCAFFFSSSVFCDHAVRPALSRRLDNTFSFFSSTFTSCRCALICSSRVPLSRSLLANRIPSRYCWGG